MKRITIIISLFLGQFGFAQSGKYVMWEFSNPYDGRNSTSQFSNLNLNDNGKFTLDIFYWKEDKEDCKKIIGTWKIENDTLSLTYNKAMRNYLIKNNSIVAQRSGKENIDYYFDELINLDFLLQLNDGSIEEHTKQNWLNQSKKSCR